jgi:hypothetical protein
MVGETATAKKKSRNFLHIPARKSRFLDVGLSKNLLCCFSLPNHGKTVVVFNNIYHCLLLSSEVRVLDPIEAFANVPRTRS